LFSIRQQGEEGAGEGSFGVAHNNHKTSPLAKGVRRKMNT